MRLLCERNATGDPDLDSSRSASLNWCKVVRGFNCRPFKPVLHAFSSILRSIKTYCHQGLAKSDAELATTLGFYACCARFDTAEHTHAPEHAYVHDASATGGVAEQALMKDT